MQGGGGQRSKTSRMELKLEYELNGDDYADAMQLNYSRLPIFVRWSSTLTPVLIFLIVFVAGGGLSGPLQYTNFIPALIFVPCSALIGFDFYSRSRRLLRKQFTKTGLGGPACAQITSKGLEQAGSHSSGLVKWSGLVRWLESPKLFLVFPQPGLFFILPKRAFPTNVDIDSFRTKLLEEIGAESVSRARPLPERL